MEEKLTNKKEQKSWLTDYAPIKESIERGEEITSDAIHGEFMRALLSALLAKEPDRIETIPINYGVYADFCCSHLEVDGYAFETDGNKLIVKQNDVEIGRCPNNLNLFDWLVGMAIYLKERNLIDDFKQFYMF